jgi:hypothetical protein
VGFEGKGARERCFLPVDFGEPLAHVDARSFPVFRYGRWSHAAKDRLAYSTRKGRLVAALVAISY